jgi:hypothetical protein
MTVPPCPRAWITAWRARLPRSDTKKSLRRISSRFSVATMFVRYQCRQNRLHAQLSQTRRIAGRVRSEHLGSLGSVNVTLSQSERLAFWAALPERLARLGNRVSEDQHAAIFAALATRIPRVTPDEQRVPEAMLLVGDDRGQAEKTIREFHYTRSIPSGKSYYVRHGEALVIWSLPANYFAGRHFMPGVGDPKVFELTRLWAPDGHERNLLTKAIAEAVRVLKQVEPAIDLVMSYADPSAGHEGFVYRAASWIPVGRSEEVRAWCHKDGGPIVPRRAFHSGSRHLNKPEVEALGYVQLKLPGKHRYVRPLSKRARRLWQEFGSSDPSDARLVWIDDQLAGRLNAIRRPGEGYANAIRRLCEVAQIATFP